MTKDLTSMYAELDSLNKKYSRKNLINYAGAKTHGCQHIIPLLPHTDRYIEVFGGTGIILQTRKKSKFEVFNDIDSDLINFFKCVQDNDKYYAMMEFLNFAPHSRELFSEYKEKISTAKDVERAGMWYYLRVYSFGGLGRNFGRDLGPKGSTPGRLFTKLQQFGDLHKRFRNVQIERLDWFKCMTDYDHIDSVFYLDPPYLLTDQSAYSGKASIGLHEEILNTIFETKGFVAISSYHNDLYDSKDWDDIHEWDHFVSIESVNNEQNTKKGIASKRSHNKEVLYIKGANNE